MHDFDVILGIDWLSKYNATIDCRKRRVIFEPMGEEKFKFVGKPKKSRTPIISALKAKKMLSNGCVGYLAHIVDTTVDATLKLEDVHVVKNFLEFFPEDLPEDHEAHLELVLQRLKEHRLYAKFKKCEFWIEQVTFLGHVISKDGVSVDPSKVEAVSN
ncbi:hypothetical protein UlMin_024289 [Ulmus minor]